MNKGLKIAGLVLFWGSTFALVTMFLRWKQRMERVDPASVRPEVGLEAQSPVPRAEGLSLFELPAPIDYNEFNSLLVELKATRAELDQQRAALADRERQVERREAELRDRQAALDEALATATERDRGETRNSVDRAVVEEVLDEQGLMTLAETYDAMRDPQLVASALSEMEPAHAAEILKRMSKRSRVDVVPLLPKDALDELHRRLLTTTDG